MSSLGRVAAGITHEIRNPLSTINMFINALRAALGGATAQASFDGITVGHIMDQLQTASDKMASIIKRVMDFAKPSEPTFVSTNLNHCIAKAVDLCAASMRGAGIGLEQNLAPDLPECLADTQLMEEVLLNLITNAQQALTTTQGPKRIRITSGVVDTVIVLAVADSGPGVPEVLRDSIFDPFYSTRAEGSGIGLSLARRIVLDHGGTLRVEDSPWGGARFTIKIPVRP
jgi:signal transduction histidine kinase